MRSKNTPSSLVFTIAIPQRSVPASSHHSQSVRIPSLSWRTSSDRAHTLVEPSDRVRLSQRIIYSANDSRLTGAGSAGSSNIKSCEVDETSLSASSSYHPSIYRVLNSNLVVIIVLPVLFPKPLWHFSNVLTTVRSVSPWRTGHLLDLRLQASCVAQNRPGTPLAFVGVSVYFRRRSRMPSSSSRLLYSMTTRPPWPRCSKLTVAASCCESSSSN